MSENWIRDDDRPLTFPQRQMAEKRLRGLMQPWILQTANFMDVLISAYVQGIRDAVEVGLPVDHGKHNSGEIKE